MATISYEILTEVQKTFFGKNLRAYVFVGQIIVKNMKPHNFAQLKLPVNGNKAIIPIKCTIPTKTEKTPTALKSVITKRMNAEKARCEKLLKPIPTKRKVVNLTAGGNYKDTLSKL